MRVSRFAAALGVAAAVLLGGATGASAATAPSVVSHATHDRGHDHDDDDWRGDSDGRWGHQRDGRWGHHHRGDGRWGHHRGDGRWGHHRDGRWGHGGHDRYDHR
ncbi:hypothetical protein [Streptomyces chiangmaiensis]|uniref:Uncharacterized protein n=1 Tax=Streptomyces chiangmaiensis TaxID=766497 RepID=A0ABU7FZX7_9ACTN|nr:hypothetical protein [Streptomyces chiangmaiensis]MED7828669.1 hypothetical protein [Streptomyces chiangmaiensis]